MSGSPDSVRAFLGALQRMATPAARRDFDARRGARPSLAMSDLTEAQVRGLGAGGLGPALRPYFPYAQVRDGLFGLARDLLGLEVRPATDSPGWSPTVETYRVYDGGRLIAKVYLDLRASPGRSVQGASTGVLRGGIRGGPPVEAVILGGMVPRAEPGLMGPQGVVTLFHEFGHLLHVMLSVRPYYWTSGAPPEADFDEVPSTLFEQWARDTAVLHRIARHYQTGAPAPDSLLVRMAAAAPQGSGIALQWRARMSLELHDGSPDRVDSIVRATFAASQPQGVDVRLPDAEIHPEDTFFHLSSYEASYYRYIWSSVISQDILSRFDHGLLDTTMVHAYRRELLDAGGSRPAMASLRAFLGRPFNLDAWARALQ
jgi:thimet oligopeptidase